MRGGIGTASVVLVFTVLCLSIFTVTALVPAMLDRRMIEAEVEFVTSYYSADTLAEQIFSEIISFGFAAETPENVMGVEINSYWDWDLFAEVVYFTIPITETQLLYTSFGIFEDSHKIFAWQMVNASEWEADGRLNVWQGNDFFSSY
ncbi:MAG: hypothetical protein LBI27_09495 [Clostridiales bacterium]|jgi:hypothetical protein|nr:hypothetical protein [Clostridiales bacterium]